MLHKGDKQAEVESLAGDVVKFATSRDFLKDVLLQITLPTRPSLPRTFGLKQVHHGTEAAAQRLVRAVNHRGRRGSAKTRTAWDTPWLLYRPISS